MQMEKGLATCDSSLTESEIVNKHNRNDNKTLMLAGERTAEFNKMNASSDNMVLPPIILGKHKKNKTNCLFPKIGVMGGSAYPDSSHYSSMHKNRVVLENTFREKVWTGDDVKIDHFGVNQNLKSVEISDNDSKVLNKYINSRRGETINNTPISKKFDQKSCITQLRNNKIIMEENQHGQSCTKDQQIRINTASNFDPMSNEHESDCLLNKPLSFRDSNWRWLTLTVVSLVTIGIFYNYDMPNSLSDLIKEKITHEADSDNEVKYNQLYSAYSYPNIVMPMICGIIVDKIGLYFGLVIFALLVAIGQGIFTAAGYLCEFDSTFNLKLLNIL